MLFAEWKAGSDSLNRLVQVEVMTDPSWLSLVTAAFGGDEGQFCRLQSGRQ